MTNNNIKQVTCFGEILWDVFPTHKVIGGAPLNVALRLKSLGAEVAIISCLGDDEDGKNALKYLEENGMNLFYVQQDSHYKTGQVLVSLDEKGSASYEINKPVAWDNIRINEANLELVSNSEVFVFGSLACRETVSRASLIKLIDKAKFKVFDVNLRPPDYTMEFILELMQKADFIKMNDEELEEVCTHLKNVSTGFEERIKYLSTLTNTKTICVTKGGDGAVLFHNNAFYNNAGHKVTIEDTVGAGDSFLATLIYEQLIKRNEPQKAIDMACAVGSLVASKKGANPKLSLKEIQEFMK